MRSYLDQPVEYTVIGALSEDPELNATLGNDQVQFKTGINVGIAISLRQGGLIAPALLKTDKQSLNPTISIRDQLDIDSMGFLNFVITLDKELHIAVSEADYAKIITLNDCVAYLRPRLENH